MSNAPIISFNEKKLFAGDYIDGFYGEVPSSQFISGDNLASLVGLTEGISINSNTNWLKFSLDNKVVFVPKKPIRYNMTWDDLNALGLVYGYKKININNQEGIIRLFNGAKNIVTDVQTPDRQAIGSEWNRLMLPISVEAPSSFKYPQYTGTTKDWNVKYTNEELGLSKNDFGTSTLCQNTIIQSPDARGARGDTNGVSQAIFLYHYSTGSYYGWRPIVEFEEDNTINDPIGIHGLKLDSKWRLRYLDTDDQEWYVANQIYAGKFGYPNKSSEWNVHGGTWGTPTINAGLFTVAVNSFIDGGTFKDSLSGEVDANFIDSGVVTGDSIFGGTFK